ncbi:MAG: tyrosine-type recombinase/integrase [Kofleriaceae bacterium]
MAKRKRIATYGKRGQLVRVFSESTPAGKLVRVQWNEFKGSPLSTESWPYSTANVTEAKAWAEGTAQRLAQGGAPKVADRSVRELATAMLAADAEAWAPNTLRAFQHRWARFEAHVGRNTPARLVTEETLDEFRAAMRKIGVVTNQRSETVKVVKQVFRWARRRKLIAENPIADYVIKLAKGEKRTDVPEWAPEEVSRMRVQLLLEGAHRQARGWRLAVAIELAALQGPRQNALRHLDVDDINLSGAERRHPQQPGVVIPPRAVWWNPAWDKLGKERIQPLTRGAVRALRIALVWRRRLEYSGPWLLAPAQDRTVAKGEPWTYQAMNKALRELCDRCDPVIPWVKGRGWHGFRKQSAGEIHRVTGSERAAADWIGDDDIKVVRKHYLKRRAEEQRDHAQRLPDPVRLPTGPRRAAAPAREPRPIPHGTRSGYNHHRCRCEACTAAQRDHLRASRGSDPAKFRGARSEPEKRNATATTPRNDEAPHTGGTSEVFHSEELT